MGIAERDHARPPDAQTDASTIAPHDAPPVAQVRVWSVTTWLIAINVAVYVLNGVFRYLVVSNEGRFIWQPISEYGQFSVATAIGQAQLWRFVTFQFLHGGVSHLLFNMFTLYFFGPMIEGHLGQRRFLAFYLLSGIGGAMLFVVLNLLGFFGTGPNVATQQLIGASGGIFGVLIAAARIAPNEEVEVYGSIPVKLKTVAWVLLGVAVITVFSKGINAGGEAAHLGGAIVGYVLIRRKEWLNAFEYGYSSGRKRMNYR